MKNFVKPICGLLSFVFLLFLGSLYQFPAQDEGSKGILPEEAGIRNRPPTRFIKNGSSGTRRETNQNHRKFTYKTAKKFVPSKPDTGQELAQVGVTFWHFRPTTAADKTKELIDSGPDEQKQAWTLERLDTQNPIKIGERLRIGIESLSRSGYLYVVDRELYTDGTLGTPHLIFPTTRIREGNNLVKPGNLLYLPPAPRYFKIQQSNPNKLLVSELLTIIISRQPLNLPEEIGEKAMILDNNLVSKWETDWKTEAVRMDLENGTGEALTVMEEQAGQNPKDLIDEGEVKGESNGLTQDDPPPQTVFRSVVKSANPFLVTVAIRYGK